MEFIGVFVCDDCTWNFLTRGLRVRERTIESVAIYLEADPLYARAQWPLLRPPEEDDDSVISLPSLPDNASVSTGD